MKAARTLRRAAVANAALRVLNPTFPIKNLFALRLEKVDGFQRCCHRQHDLSLANR